MNKKGTPVEGAPLIEVRDLVKRYGAKTILDRVSLRVERGETIVVIGGSGTGKTTLARLIIGLDRPTSGSVLVEGVDLGTLHGWALVQQRRRFAMVFQGAALLDSMTVLDNVAFPLRETTHLGDEEVRERARAQLRELGVEQAENKLPAQLSGGMAKRVGMARALVTEPEILVYDEPTSGLDPVTARMVDALIDHMRERFLVTSIVITHDVVTAYSVADRVVLLASGHIVADGPPEEVFRSHSDVIRPFAASSGVDLDRLAKRPAHKPASEIRAAWSAAHPAIESEERGRFRRWLERAVG